MTTPHTARVNFDDTDHGTAPHTPRLRLEPPPRDPPQRPAGAVNGAWWPHTDDLGAELPDLLTALSARLDPVERIVYHPDDWAWKPTPLPFHGRTVGLEADPVQPTGTISVIGVDGTQVAFLVVPPHTDPDRAHTTLTTAAAAGDASTVADLLAISSPNEQTDRHLQPAQQREAVKDERRWKSDGGP